MARKRTKRRARRKASEAKAPALRTEQPRFGIAVFAVVIVVGLAIGFLAMLGGGTPPL